MELPVFSKENTFIKQKFWDRKSALVSPIKNSNIFWINDRKTSGTSSMKTPTPKKTLMSPWNTDLWAILKPLMYFCRLFGCNYMTESKSLWVRRFLIGYCVFNCLNATMTVFMSFTWFDSSDSLKPATVWKISTLMFCIFSYVSIIFNLRTQLHTERILACAIFIDNGRISQNQKESLRKRRNVGIAFMSIFIIALAVTVVLVLCPGPVPSPFKPHYFVEIPVLRILFMVNIYMGMGGFIGAVGYNIFFCSLMCRYIEELHKSVLDISKNALGPLIINQFRLWLNHYHSILSFLDCLQDTLGWFVFCATSAYCIEIILALLIFARGTDFQISSTIAFLILLVAMVVGLVSLLLPIVMVNEKALLQQTYSAKINS